MSQVPRQPSDEMLVAFLDSQLSEPEQRWVAEAVQGDRAIAERLDFLAGGDAPFAGAFQPLLDQAPTVRLQQMLDGLPAASSHRPAAFSRRGLLAAAACVFAGIAADRLYLSWRHAQDYSWRGLVAEYMALYTPQTLENLPVDEASRQAQLATVGARLGLSLNTGRLLLPGAELRRAQILEYDSVPIAQITYLDAQHGPLALCITPSSKGVSAPHAEQRLGMNVVYWGAPAHAFMLIGHNSPAQLQAMAVQMAREFA